MSIPPHIQDLLQSYFDGDSSLETTQGIEAWLKEDPGNLQLFAEYGVIEDILFSEQDTIDSEAVHTVVAEMEPTNTTDALDSALQIQWSHLKQTRQSNQALGVIGYVGRQALRRYAVGLASAAALLVLGLVLWIVLSGPNGDPSATPLVNTPDDGPGSVNPTVSVSPTVVAVLAAERDAVWDRRPEGDLFAGDRFTLTQGFAEIVTAKGAVVILEAPATVELLDNNNALRLHTGKLVGLCETPSSKGLLIRTPRMDITDIGTEFGVEVKASQTTATVITGEIEIATPNAVPKRMTANQTATLTQNDGGFALEIENRLAEGFARSLPVRSLVTHATLSVNDFQCQIVSQGVKEDAKLYTDREHEINGIDATGLPAALRGGDIIRMPAQASTFLSPGKSGIKLQITVSQPADVYVLMPTSAEPREWLESDYTQTDLRVGFDIGKRPINSKHELGVGPGQSIDAEFIVWKRNETLTGTGRVAFGMKKSMYGVIVVPTEANP